MPRTKKSSTKRPQMKSLMMGKKGAKGGMQLMKKRVQKAAKPLRKSGLKGGASIAMGSAAGAIVGATVGGIAGAALSNANTRRAVGHTITSFAKNAQHNIEAISSRADDLKKSTDEVRHTAHNVQRRMTKK